MRRNVLYTVNKWNRPAFMPHLYSGLFEQSQQMQAGSNPFGVSLSPDVLGGLKSVNPNIGQQRIDFSNPIQRAAAIGTSAGLVNGFKDAGTNLLTQAVSSTGGKGLLNAKNFGAGTIGGSVLNAGAGLLGGLANNAISGGLSSGAGNAVGSIGSTIGGAVGAVNPVAGAAVTFASNLVGGAINRLWGESVDQEKLNKVNENISALNNFTSNAGSFDEIQGPQAVSMDTDVYEGGLFTSDDAEEKNRKLKEKLINAKLFAQRSVDNNVYNLKDDQINNALANYSAFGGSIGFGSKEKTFDGGGGLLALDFMNDFGSDPIGAVVRYRKGLEDLAAREELLDRSREQGLRLEAIQNATPNYTINVTKNYGPKMPGVPPTEEMPEIPVLPDIPGTIRKPDPELGLSSYTSKATPNDYSSLKDSIKMSESFSDKAYTLGDEKYPTIGYGFYNIYPGTNRRIQAGDTITKEEADRYLDVAIAERERDLATKVPNWNKMTQNQRDALVDLAFNAGSDAPHFRRDSKLMRALENEDWEEASKHLATTSKNPAFTNGMRNRSNRRRNMFVNGDYGLKAFGGELGTNGTDFTNGLLYIDEGGSHESNPLDGVPMGVDAEGIPNLVEEGETVYDNYVFSDRLKVPGFMYKELGLGGVIKKKGKEMSFADASKKLAQESEKRPNDPISQNGLEASLSRLAEVQEAERMKKQAKKYTGLEGYACGGKMGRKYSGTGSYPNVLLYEDDDFGKDKRKGYSSEIVYPPMPDPIQPVPIEVPPVEPKIPKGISRGYIDTFGINTDNGNNYVYKGIEMPKTYDTWMRKLPAYGSTTMYLTDLLGITNNPDYTYANQIEAAANAAGAAPNVGYKLVGDYMKYDPLDRLFYTSQLQANTRATDRAIMNSSSPSKAAALLASGYNATNGLGNLYRQAEEYNLAQREKVADFNRRTNMFNSQMGLEAAMANARYKQAAQQMRMSGLAQAAALRDQIDARISAARSANLSNALTSWGNIGRENLVMNQLNWDRSRNYYTDDKGRTYYKGRLIEV